MAATPKRIVVKLGTGILTKGIGIIDTDRIGSICAQIAEARRHGIETIVVSSGAIGMGMGALGLKARPQTLAKQQACAAIGQSRLIQSWQEGFNPFGLTVGQVLLTHEGLRIRNRYVNAKATIDQLLAYGTIPVINENDSISAFEIRFGNNDTLGCLVASLSDADHLYILSTAPGLIDMDGTGEIVPVIEKITPQIEAMAKGTDSPTAVGGMITKIEAAKTATEAGCHTYIAHGAEPNIILRLIDGESVGTHFHASPVPMVSKKRWLAYFQRPDGSITVDDGARRAILREERSLLASGIIGCAGVFQAGDVVDVLDKSGKAIARGEIQYTSHEISQIKDQSLDALKRLYPKKRRFEAIHRDALVLI